MRRRRSEAQLHSFKTIESGAKFPAIRTRKIEV